MAFPFTHLCVGLELLKIELLKSHSMSENDKALFMLGTVAPDGIHYRESFLNSNMKSIGPAKKITHLCPVSGERWGAITDNDGWTRRVFEFLETQPADPLRLGYAVHVLTDIYNNLTLWESFRTNYPAEAAKGYASEYYTDMHEIHGRLYEQTPYANEIMELLSKSNPQADIKWNGELLITMDEMDAIKQNLIHDDYKNAKERITPGYEYKFVTYDDMLGFISGAASQISAKVFLSPSPQPTDC